MTDVKLVKDCGLYPSYKKIIDFTGTKSQIISKQISWINGFTHRDELDVNYNKFQNKLVMPIDYEEALTYTYCVLSNITGTEDNPQFFFVDEVENLTNGIDNAEPNVAFYLSLDTIMTYMGDWRIDECMVDREHVDRWRKSTGFPIRITPNTENVSSFDNVALSNKIRSELDGYDIAIIMVAFTSDKMDIVKVTASTNPIDNLYYAIFPVFVADAKRTEQIKTILVKDDYRDSPNPSIYPSVYPSMSMVIDGTFLGYFDIAPEDVVSVSVIPINNWNVNSAESGDTISVVVSPRTGRTVTVTLPSLYSEYFWITDNPATYYKWTLTQIEYLESRVVSSVDIDDLSTMGSTMLMQVFTYASLIESSKNHYLNYTYPSKPSDGANATPNFEPALFMSPYVHRYVTDGKGQPYLEIPDNVYYDNSSIIGQIPVTFREMLDGATSSLICYIGEPSNSGVMGCSGVIPNESLYVVNDAWKTYNLTKKDSERQMTTNYAIKNAVDNLIYMSYGGTLVGSRSMGKDGLYKSGERQWVQNRVRGRFASGGHWQKEPGELTAAGERVVKATALAGGASIVTSLIDAHTAWANQMEKEKMVKNQPAGLLQNATGQSILDSDFIHLKAIEVKADTISYNKAYENFRKYGYWISKFEKPNIQSRKYFNYILTNGAIINGAINQTIRDTIASIFDAGVTIFHYDSGDTTTRNLEYTDKENIEVSLL